MKKDQYLKFPLSLLFHASNQLDHFGKAASIGAVNAGIGFRINHQECAFQAKLEDVATENCDEEVVVGASVCGINLEDETGQTARKVYESISELCKSSPFVNIKADFFHAAYHSAQKEAEDTLPPLEKWISWREYRVLLAIYSLQWNNKNYCEAGWESIRCRACGFHNKASYREFVESEQPWPDHITPLSRDQITRTVKKLEELKFFLRVRVSSNSRHGGKYAYSIKHESREALIRDVESKQAYSRGDIIRENRAKDHLLQLQAKAARQRGIKLDYAKAEEVQRDLASLRESQKQQIEMTAEAYKYSKPASHQQVGQQGCPQHNEKSSDEKFRDEKSLNEKCINDNIPSEVALSDQDQLESGYLIDDRFLKRDDANKLVVRMPNLWSQFKKAKRHIAPDGTQRIEVIAA
jgi:hypothetical protein